MTRLASFRSFLGSRKDWWDFVDSSEGGLVGGMLELLWWVADFHLSHL